ncbi:hypothetical protein Pla163_02700 [Planctomycetes bacterium Pla163]|uniref:Uncharacterized protein n=1 Tax=Rohdeia mirabilis TaxID=2528008 RepID=A0A518CVB2_9BACT|nr:hypothetical protein Pla163_02700 [Planctomycetes bacterium Pla163]
MGPRLLHVVLFALSLASAGCMPGQRLLDARIEVDGAVVAETYFSIDDHRSEGEAWSRLDGAVFEAVGAGLPAPDAEGRVELTGAIGLVLDHAGDPFVGAELVVLLLVPDAAGSGGWCLAPGEVERTRPPK